MRTARPRLTLAELLDAHDTIARRDQAARRKVRRHLVVAAIVAALLGLAASAFAQAGWTGCGRLEASDPRYLRAELGPDGCTVELPDQPPLDVAFDVWELVLAGDGPLDLTARTCAGYDFDTVVLLYQRPDGAPGAFDPAQPCSHLVASDDDGCGPASIVAAGELVAGHVDVVVTSATADVGLGRYGVWMLSGAAPLEDFIFYSGFETADARTWPSATP